MKIAIQGHPTRGKEVIQILESLGGINRRQLYGSAILYYYIDYYDDKTIHCHDDVYVNKYCKKYTLEEFEKEFPFKVGDRVISITTGCIGIITKCNKNGCCYVKYDNGNIACAFGPYLKFYKEMQEERNITLTLEKAKEWYKKGGELKEVALQAFTEKELNPLPKSWEEFCEKYPIKKDESYINSGGKISFITKPDRRDWNHICPSKQSAEAHLAMIQLEQLRNCWWNGWEPEWNFCEKYAIKNDKNKLHIIVAYSVSAFLVFPTREMAEEFLECFRNLIEKAGDLI